MRCQLINGGLCITVASRHQVRLVKAQAEVEQFGVWTGEEGLSGRCSAVANGVRQWPIGDGGWQCQVWLSRRPALPTRSRRHCRLSRSLQIIILYL